ncbi:unnamed protein product [Miscanthus lutarioriparius]|uniref:Uncharacterized protein n=1 Tax=Miscanthus lutarioriparius TaxID=422564 RepID=A0A811PFF1_9POAL|nr:unnamed protein product [Miscanthus lutarioriparius]
MELPCHDRTLLRARSPPTVHPDALLTLHPKPIFSDPEGPLAFEVFTISRDQVASLKHLCGGTSTFCALSSLIWQCTCVARQLPPESEVRIVFPADLQRRMRPPLPSHYYGNAMFRLCVTGAAGEIGTAALGSIAARIKGTVERMDDELVRSAIDYFQMAEMDKRPALRGTLPLTDLHILPYEYCLQKLSSQRSTPIHTNLELMPCTHHNIETGKYIKGCLNSVYRTNEIMLCRAYQSVLCFLARDWSTPWS